MFQSNSSSNPPSNPPSNPSSKPDEAVPTSATFNLPTFNQETVRHILLGDYTALIAVMQRLAALGYCDRTAWMDPLPTGRSGEYITVMTRRRTLP